MGGFEWRREDGLRLDGGRHNSVRFALYRCRVRQPDLDWARSCRTRYRPLSHPLFLYVRVTALKNGITRTWVEQWLKHGAQVAGEAKVVALSEPAYHAGIERLS